MGHSSRAQPTTGVSCSSLQNHIDAAVHTLHVMLQWPTGLRSTNLVRLQVQTDAGVDVRYRHIHLPRVKLRVHCMAGINQVAAQM